MTPDRFGLYVHIPFCVRKCPYCDFNTFAVEREAVRTFLDALRRELELLRDRFAPPPFDTLFIGGGTPTVLSGSQLSDVIGWVRDAVGLQPVALVTVEAFPGSVTVKGLRAMEASGVTRVSLGVQSLSDELLQRIGRNHTVRDVLVSVEQIREAGIPSVNFDLMYGLPGQTRREWIDTLTGAIALSPDHLSCYSLIIEEGTPFADLHREGRLDLPHEDDEAWMYEETLRMCEQAGYEHYEISNFARPGHQCRHNLIYWRNDEWLGAGPGSHSSWQGQRHWNVRGLAEYAAAVRRGVLPIEGREELTADERMDDTMMLGLRLTAGVSLTAFRRRFDRDLLAVYGSTVERLRGLGLVEIEDDHLRLTPRGRLLGNRVIAELLR